MSEGRNERTGKRRKGRKGHTRDTTKTGANRRAAEQRAAVRGRFYRRNQGQRAKGKATRLALLPLRYTMPLRQVYGRRCTDVLSPLPVPAPLYPPFRPLFPPRVIHLPSFHLEWTISPSLEHYYCGPLARSSHAYPDGRVKFRASN